MSYIKGRSRAKIWKGAGQVVVGPAKSRACPQCPAQPYRSCLRWVGEHYANNHGGRWERMTGVHAARQSPGSPDSDLEQYLNPELQRACEQTGMHRGHTHGNDPELWCRGRI